MITVVFVPEAPDGGRRARRRDRPGGGSSAAAGARLTPRREPCTDNSVHGDPASGGLECTTVEVHTVAELLAGDDVDWTTVGIVARVLLEPPVG